MLEPVGEPLLAEDRPSRAKPETLRLRAIMPELDVGDLTRSIAWYRDILGFVVSDIAELDGHPIAVQLKAGNVQFLLRQRRAGPMNPPMRGFRILCATRQDLADLTDELEARGARIEFDPSRGPHEITVIDPDGFRISIAA
ncbi:MAG TPA: VOC family protein [Gemmatimonadales bacterium]